MLNVSTGWNSYSCSSLLGKSPLVSELLSLCWTGVLLPIVILQQKKKTLKTTKTLKTLKTTQKWRICEPSRQLSFYTVCLCPLGQGFVAEMPSVLARLLSLWWAEIAPDCLSIWASNCLWCIHPRSEPGDRWVLLSSLYRLGMLHYGLDPHLEVQWYWEQYLFIKNVIVCGWMGMKFISPTFI